MTAWRPSLLAVAALLLAASAPQRAAQDPAFVALDLWVDTRGHELAAWQCELVASTATLVGIEGSEHAAFADAPRYDPAALQGGRVILAALANGERLPRGKVRVARIHVMEPDGRRGEYALRGLVAGDARGARIESAAEVRPRGEDR